VSAAVQPPVGGGAPVGPDVQREPFVSQLRTGPELLRLGDGTEPSIAIRVEIPEVWDAVRVETPLTEPVLAIKLRALDVLYPDANAQEDFLIKLNGLEVRDENASIGAIGAKNGSTLLLTFRRRRPVR
jgi:hypothetical protein